MGRRNRKNGEHHRSRQEGNLDLDTDGFDKNREPQYNGRNVASGQAAAVSTDASSDGNIPQQRDVDMVDQTSDGDWEHVFGHYPISIDSENTETTARPGSDQELWNMMLQGTSRSAPPPVPLDVHQSYQRHIVEHVPGNIGLWVEQALPPCSRALVDASVQGSMAVEKKPSSTYISVGLDVAVVEAVTESDVVDSIVAAGAWSYDMSLHPCMYASDKLTLDEE